MPRPIEDEAENCQSGHRLHQWLTPADRGGVSCLPAWIRTNTREITDELNEELLCADTSFLCLTTLTFLPIDTLNTECSVSQ